MKLDGKALMQWAIASDLLRSEGVTSKSVSAGGAHREEVKEGIVIPSLSAGKQALLSADIRALNAEQKKARRDIMQEIGSKLGKVVRHLRTSEGLDGERAPRAASTLEATLRKEIEIMIKKVQKAEKVTFSATNMVKHLTEALALVK